MGVDFTVSRRALPALSLGLALATPFAAIADPIEDFYRNKTIDMVIGYSPGGT